MPVSTICGRAMVLRISMPRMMERMSGLRAIQPVADLIASATAAVVAVSARPGRSGFSPDSDE
ncbi:hypothetical protein D3C77_759500 [compost metagenome]